MGSLAETSLHLFLKNRPIGAVVYMQHNNLKMCLRTVDGNTDTSEVAKVPSIAKNTLPVCVC